ncbi:hypothetical protein Poli38472_013347 [Pythium oligandrum]|uniref:Uncharacterized protein n=1 Tax=Pythium oligandrum TaxID=41045 RepID=A0A8K1C7J9_PYTOL|nr:hypothetical protein Poli38472_013347 [Pythium oligandrum]|eukprot:TMW57873.1 hypothetical protein Poli38472_013347 [Pythium oligandrum]
MRSHLAFSPPPSTQSSVMFTQERLTFFSQHFLLPFVLLVNFVYCRYLVTIYFTRRHERRVRLLLVSAVLGFLSLMLFSYPNDTLVENLNDMSEVCSVLTFLIQVMILGRDVTRRIKVRSLRYMTLFAELLILLESLSFSSTS